MRLRVLFVTYIHPLVCKQNFRLTGRLFMLQRQIGFTVKPTYIKLESIQAYY